MRRRLTILLALLGVGLMIFYLLHRLIEQAPREAKIAEIRTKYVLPDKLPERIAELHYFSGVSNTDDIYLGQKAYEDKQFKLAASHFDRAIKMNPGRFDLVLYHALCYIHMDDYQNALSLLDQIINNPDKPFATSEALWYAALVHLDQNNYPECQQKLKKLIELEEVQKDKKFYKEVKELIID